jgi:hypothetical protein
MEKPMSAEEITKLIEIVDTTKLSEDTSFHKLIVKDFKKSYIYLSSFNTRNILALSIINYFIDNDIGNTWNFFPNKIKITNWYKVLKLYFFTNFLLNLIYLGETKTENIYDKFKLLLDKKFYGLGLNLDLEIHEKLTRRYLKKKNPNFKDYLQILLENPNEVEEYVPVNYFEKDIMDLLNPNISASTNSTAGGSRKKVRKTKKYNSRAKKHTKRR